MLCLMEILMSIMRIIIIDLAYGELCIGMFIQTHLHWYLYKKGLRSLKDGEICTLGAISLLL